MGGTKGVVINKIESLFSSCFAIDSEFCFLMSLTFILLFYHWIVADLWNKTLSKWQKGDTSGHWHWHIASAKKGAELHRCSPVFRSILTILIFFMQFMQLDFNGRVIQLETNTADEFRSDEQSMVYHHHMTMVSNLELS